MPMSYKKLWKILIDRGLNKTDLRQLTGMGTAAMAKLSKGGTVTTETIERICTVLGVQPGDIMEIVNQEQEQP